MMYDVKRKGQSASPVRKTNKTAQTERRTGIPSRLKNGIEHLSGYSMDDVRIHYNSSKPSRFRALGYTQDNHVYLKSGQEKHLGHELWHVVQQKQGRVMPTGQINGLTMNNSAKLEHEADLFGTKAAQFKPEEPQRILSVSTKQGSGVLQCLREEDQVYDTLRACYEADLHKQDINWLIGVFTDDSILDIDISHYDQWNDVRENIKALVKKSFSDNPRHYRALYDKYSENLTYLEGEQNLDNIWYTLFGENCGCIGKSGINTKIFGLLYYHDNLDRADAPPEGSKPLTSTDNDIDTSYDKGKSCVITALFCAEGERIREEFGAGNVEAFHNVLVNAFHKNKYAGSGNEHQENNVWKNYSDDAVYPSLYQHFGYTPHMEAECIGMYLQTAVGCGKLPCTKGMIYLRGHMIFFDNSDGQARTFMDNDNQGNSVAILKSNGSKEILCIYYKGTADLPPSKGDKKTAAPPPKKQKRR